MVAVEKVLVREAFVANAAVELLLDVVLHVAEELLGTEQLGRLAHAETRQMSIFPEFLLVPLVLVGLLGTEQLLWGPKF